MSYLELLKALEKETAEKAEKERKVLFDGVTEEVSGAEKAERAEEASPPATSRYAFPWPDEIGGLGRHNVGPFVPCENCGRGTWVRYGLWALCLACANLGKRL